jgi:hypothetical protein
MASLASAQEVTGSITGSVADPTGSSIAGATVKLISESTGAVRSASSDATGVFVFSAVAPGVYTVSAEQDGFKMLRKQHVELTPGDKLAVGEFRLEIGLVSDSVTVRAEGAAIQTATSERSGIVTSDEIKDLTVINRDFTTFAELLPGIVVNVSAEVQSFTGNNSINALGGRTTTNNILIDGIPSSNSNMASMNTTISLDATQTVEVKVSNFSAEYGRNSGVTIMAVSKGGGQQVHGAAYYYDRNEAFNANNFFNNQKGLPLQKYRISTGGGNIGGPLHIPHLDRTKGKLFFLASMEEIREVRPKAEQDVTVPTALERLGDFSQSVNNSGKAISIKDPLTGLQFPNNVIPSNRVLKSTQSYLNLLPLPNALNSALTKYQYNYIFQESLNVPKRIDTGRLDYNATDSTMMYLRFNYWWEDQSGAAVSGGNPAWGWLPSHYTATTPSAIYHFTHILNPTTVAEAAMGFQRFTEAGPALNDAELQAKTRSASGVSIPQFNPSMNPLSLVPQASFGGVTNAANPSYATRFPLRGAENTFNWTGSLAKTLAGHTLKAGTYIERWRAMKGEEANFAGTLAFGSDSNNPGDTGYAYSNALIGTLANYTESNQRPPVYEYTTSAEWYLEDSWRVSRRLTLDLGVRFGWGQPWHSVQNLEASFVPALWNPQQAVKLIGPTMATVAGKSTRMALDPYTGAILPLVDLGAIAPEQGSPFNGTVFRITTPSYPQGMRNTDGVKTAPRVGFNWDPTGRGKTVIRAGGGLFYNVHERDNYQSKIQLTPPIQTTETVEYTTVQSFIGAAAYQFPNSTNAIDPDRHVQMNMNFSFNVQHELGFGTVLDVAYVGNLGRHLLIRRDLNGTPLGTNWLPQNADATNGNKVLPTNFLRPYPGYSNVWFYTYGGNSNYHSMQTTVRRRYKNNLTYGVVWTWSKAMDYADDDGASTTMTVSSLIDPKVWNYGKAGFDHTHIFRFYYTYSLPRVAGNHYKRAALDGWQLSGITTFQSGAPMGISPSFVSSSSGGPASSDVTGSTDSWRVIMTDNPILPKDQRSTSAFNVNAFTAPPVTACQAPGAPFLCWGNAPKDVFRGPGINNWDASLFKNFNLHGEKVRGQFRVEAYNVFNHTNFSGVNTSAQFDKNGVQTNQQFGQYTAAQFPRRLQLALRVTF